MSYRLLVGMFGSAFLCSSVLEAKTLTATFTFDKRTPDVGVLYLPDGAAPAKVEAATLEQKDKDFVLPLVLAAKGGKVFIKNSDSIAHNIFADDTETGVKFDIGLAEAGSVKDLPLTWDEGVFVKIGCKIHPKMRAWIGSVKSQFVHMAKFEDGKPNALQLKGFPDNLTKVRVWLSNSLEAIETTVADGATVTLPIMKKANKQGEVTFKRE